MRDRTTLMRTRKLTIRTHKLTIRTHKITVRARRATVRQHGALVRAEQRLTLSNQRIEDLERICATHEAILVRYTDERGMSYRVLALNGTFFFLNLDCCFAHGRALRAACLLLLNQTLGLTPNRH
ncbi:hypothetical protein RSAG8_12427, partial [Rhizoctonia solani AG-8 WAC10335]